MSGRAVIAGELQHTLEELQRLCIAGERLATASGMVKPGYFRSIQTVVQLAAGELDQKGLLVRDQQTRREPA